ncbi:MAG: glycosyltransferase, partial [Bacillales bacterium]|nr:glycosyltransferase [Bacillales bacterium]
MQPNLSPIKPNVKPKSHRFYINVKGKFWISHAVSLGWMAFSIYLSFPWLEDLSSILSFPLALFVIGGIAYIPGYMNAFLVISLLLDRQPAFKNEFPSDPVTLLIAAYNEEKTIFNTLRYVAAQDYGGEISIFVINNHSIDHTDQEILRAKQEFDLNITILHEEKPGKFHALNKGLQYVAT